MRIYTIHRRGGEAETKLQPIKEGFCWPAALFTVLWALRHGLWATALVLVAVQVVAGTAIALAGADPLTDGAVGLGIAAVFGYLANDLRRRRLERRGWGFEDVVAAANPEEAEWRYLAKQDLAVEAWAQRNWRGVAA